ncbi:MAG TPA: type I DNA topoisomerase [Chlamydiales bacterium]|nr:type I DNA topoisomerase [Chlamydiales bacterium]
MGKALVIVESPTKIKTLKKFLGDKFIFESSLGHIRDLPQKEFGIDTEHDFEPKYVMLPDKKDVIKRLQAAAKKADTVYLSPDPDREGEAIAWHIASILPKSTKIKRVAFQSITKAAVQEALEHPRDIDMDLVDAQQARRLLDRIVGYKISPILTRKVKRGSHGTSAGRVQSVALKLVVDREKAIEAFNPVEYWTLEAQLETPSREKPFTAYLNLVDGIKIEKEKGEKPCFLIPDKKTSDQLLARLKKARYHVGEVEHKEKKRNPVPPFITSTIQQEASRHYGFNVSRTMGIAQSLYEGIDMGEHGAEGLITYMRTDSVNIAPEAIAAARAYIGQHFGPEYLPEQPKIYASKKTAQEAHEGIRPTNLARDPERIRKYLSIDEYKLYLLIWRRFIASQMNPAIYDTVSAEIETDQGLTLRATGSIVKFNGYLAAYEEKKDKSAHAEEEDENAKLLPPLTPNMPLSLLNALSTQSFTKPPPRFTEASLVKELERLGIGRPSTYAAIMNKIQSRDYTIKEASALKPTELGKVICQMLEDNFASIMDVTFTAQMEDQLEQVAEHNKNWKELVRDFWHDFIPLVEKAEKEAVVPKLMTDRDCPKCGSKLQKIWARSKYFYGCSHYPDCDFTAPLEALDFKKEDYDANFDWDQPCPLCGDPMVLRFGRFGPFLGCTKYPECKGIVNIAKRGEAVFKPEDLPICPAIGCDGRLNSRKSRFGKIFFSCSNYPDCDVIVNHLEDLESKYPNHPKTPYVKKKKGRFGAKGKEEKVPAKGKKSKRTSSQPAYHLSPELAALVDAEELSRPEVTKRLWVYIKENNLQDPKNKRTIVPDAKLAKVIGKNPIDMMKLAALLSKHFKK